MRFRFGKIPDNVDFLPEEGNWIPIKEPSPWLAQLFAFPIGIALGVLFIFLWSYFTSTTFYNFPTTLILIFFCIPLTVIIHELIHALAHPNNGRSDNTICGYWPSKTLFYAHYDGILSKQRFITILILPLIFISIPPLLLCIFFSIDSFFLMFVSVFNAICSCVDLLGAILLFFQIPAAAVTRNKAWKTYYRLPENSDPL
ncbi:MAG: DUF3267 domain-containing protein [Planctomycetota bacterium]|jgi:hypothetical protein